MLSIEEAGLECEEQSYSDTSLRALDDAIQHWTHSHELLDRSSDGRIDILNHLTWLLPNDRLRPVAWAAITDLARRYPLGDEYGLGEALVIATFELAAEPPDVPSFLELLFSLAKTPETRWAVFAAYRHFPDRFERHVRDYAQGSITPQEYDAWLETLDLHQPPLGPHSTET